MKNKKMIALLLAAAMVFSLAACGSKEEPAAAPEAETEAPAEEEAPAEAPADEAKEIGIAIYAMTADSCVAVVDGVKAAAEPKGWTVNLQDANGDPSTQADQMNTLIAAGVDVIFLNPTDVASLKPSLEAAKDAGIPVIGIGMMMNDECMALLSGFVGLDDYANAEGVSKWVAENYNGQGAEMAVITGAAGTDPTFKTLDAINTALEGTDITVVGDYDGKYDAAEAMAITENLLVSNPELDIIFCQDHVMAGGAASALADAGKTGEVALVAICGMMDYLDYIKDGSIQMVGMVIWSPMGAFMVEIAEDVFAGNTEAPVYFMNPLAITQENVDSVEDSMFEFTKQ